MTQSWDYIVVGAGSAGCVVAEQLSASGKHSVLLLEAGGKESFWNRVPKGVAKLVTNPDKIWTYKVGQPRIEGEQGAEFWIRGKGMGGSSSVNGMIWSRGEPEDYDIWERDHGATGWNGASMTEAFKALEDHPDGPTEYLGSGGPVHIDPAIYSYPLADEMIAAGETLGLPKVRELNSRSGPRVGLYSHNIRDGKRQSAATAFIKPALKRPNLTVVSGALAERIMFEDQCAVAVEARVEGELRRFECRGEVIVSAGAIESPLLLQRSGIGVPALLESLEIPVVAANPHVGEHLVEHLSFSMPYRLKSGRGTHKSFYGWGLIKAAARYLLTGKGILATGPFEVGAFLNVYHPDKRTDAQLYLGAYTFAVGDENNPVPLDQIDRRPGITIYGSLLRLTSEGQLRIGGRSIADPPEIRPNFLSTEHDRASAVAMIRSMRAFMDSHPLSTRTGDEVLPGRAVESDADILDAFKRLSSCGLHGLGSCRMGIKGQAVVDPQLRVFGVSGVRVADCSIVPGHITGNTNAPAMAIGLRASQMILADNPV